MDGLLLDLVVEIIAAGVMGPELMEATGELLLAESRFHRWLLARASDTTVTEQENLTELVRTQAMDRVAAWREYLAESDDLARAESLIELLRTQRKELDDIREAGSIIY
jgi:hypothetical protein